ncbi:F0F1 ATP synthase subunit delta [Paenibacillus sp. P96]|uniref:ATP synthase subunit delta n=1 Tax=Paenibacillus zeirhizosphaerae TaxID=2987519 RepID=A0ABT9FMY8_9BACL|nr:F0F1 ATP synthase subunit delta [Paenibacillus sp. P96]MDP4096092.1 F0F1 ATP synthase subunit delta [Paenibacillus sp. P96]
MSQDTVVAKRYAKALFEVAEQQQKVTETEQELRAFVEAVSGDAEIRDFIHSPNVTESVKLQVLAGSFENKLSAPVLSTIKLMIQRGRADLFSALLDGYLAIQEDKLGVADAKVFSVYALSNEEKATVAEQFGARVNKTIRVENIVDPELLGGLKVVIGDTMFDGSVAGKLERLEKSFNRRV